MSRNLAYPLLTLMNLLFFVFLALISSAVSFSQINSVSELKGAECVNTEYPARCIDHLIKAVDLDLGYYQDLDRTTHLESKAEFIAQLAFIELEIGNEEKAFDYIRQSLSYLHGDVTDHGKNVRDFIVGKSKSFCGKQEVNSEIYSKCDCEAYVQDLTPLEFMDLKNGKREKELLNQALSASTEMYNETIHSQPNYYILSCIKSYIQENPLNTQFKREKLSDQCIIEIGILKRGEYVRKTCDLRSTYYLDMVGSKMMGLSNVINFPKEMLDLDLTINLVIEPGEDETYEVHGDTYYITYKQ